MVMDFFRFLLKLGSTIVKIGDRESGIPMNWSIDLSESVDCLGC
jgi:hypothetical protein